MFQTEITIKGKERLLKFSTWVNGQIEIIAKKEIGSIDLLAHLIFYGLIQGEGLRARFIAKDEIGFDVFDCYDFIDEQEGGLGGEMITKIQELYVQHNKMNVPKNQTATAPKTKLTVKK